MLEHSTIPRVHQLNACHHQQAHRRPPRASAVPLLAPDFGDRTRPRASVRTSLRPAPSAGPRVGPEPSSLTCRHVVARGPRHRPDDCCRKGCTVLLAAGGGGPSAGDLLTGRPAYSITAAQAVRDCGPRHTRAVRVRPPCRKATRAVASVRPSCCARRNPRGVPSASHRFAFATPEAVRRALVCGGRGAEKGEDDTEEMPVSNDGQRCRRLLAMINGRTKHVNTAIAPAGSGT